MNPIQSQAAQSFVEKFGLMIESEGLPRIAGRIMAYLLLSDHPCDAATLASSLQISHGSVSTNTRLLERLEVIERITVPGERATSYQLTSDPYGRILAGQLERMRRTHAMIASASSEIEIPAGQRRLRAMEQFYDIAIASTENLLQAWTETKHDDASKAAQ